MRHRIIFATGDRGEVREIHLILADLRPPILSVKEAGAEPEIVENSSAFGENAEIKARAVWNLAGGIVLTDDSGLEVDYTDREPGIYSARYLGEDTPYVVKNRSIIKRFKEAGGQERSARFMCNIAAILPDGQVFHAEAVVGGFITGESTGEGSFGYDPTLYLPEFSKISAEITMNRKNEIGHREKASRAMKEILEGMLR